jgi:hypothetical protein
MTNYLSLLSMAEPLPSKERSVWTKSVFPMYGILAWIPATQLSRYQGGELSFSCKEECLSLHTFLLTEEGKSGNGQQ